MIRYFCTNCFHIGEFKETIFECKKCGSRHLARGDAYSYLVQEKMQYETETKIELPSNMVETTTWVDFEQPELF